jgi:DNA repair protein RadC
MDTLTKVTPIRSAQPLYVRDGSQLREARSSEIINGAEALILARYRKGESILDHPRRTAAYLRIRVGSKPYRAFGILHLDTDGRLIEAEDLFHGTLDCISIHPRDVMESVISHRSTSVIFYQNCPSGVSEPRDPDIRVVQRLKIALGLMDVLVRDCLFVGAQIFSFVANGLM